MPSYAIVGASRGLGYAWLKFLSQDPANTVIGLARTPGPVEERLKKDGITNVHVLPGDMVSHSSLAKAAEFATPLLPSGLDVLIINGAWNPKDTTKIPLTGFSSPSQAEVLYKDMHSSIDVNVLGVVYSINAFLPLVLKGQVKKIVAISTGLADYDLTIGNDKRPGNPMYVTYSTAKAALNMIVAKASAELKPKGVKLLSLSPGVVDTREGNQSEEETKNFEDTVANFKKAVPQWTGPLTPLESVKAQKEVIDNLTLEDTGKFLSHHGNKMWL